MKRIFFIAAYLIAFQAKSQNVGIGTTTPAANFKLHVHDNVSADVSIGISNGITSDALGRGIRLRMSYTDFSVINQEPLGNIHFFTSALNRMSITSGGSVGMGTTVPDYSLHIARASTEASVGINATGTANQSLLNLSIDSRAANNSLALLKYRSGVVGTIYGIPKSNLSLISSEAGSGPLLIGTNQNSDLYFATNSVERMKITNDGQVRINSPAIGSGYAWLKVDNSDLGYNIFAANTNTTSPAYSLYSSIVAASGGAVVGVSSTSGSNSSYTPGKYGVIGLSGAGGNGVGAFTISGGTALRATVTSGVGTAIYSAGNLQFTGIGEASNKVLTTDASGNATWQNIPVTTGTWSVNGNNIYNSNTGNVGIGTTAPDFPLDIISATPRTGNFVNAAVAADNFGVYSSCMNTAGYGYGVYGQGGKVGVQGNATFSGAGDRTGLYGVGQFGTGNNYGVRGQAFGGTTAIGIYSTAGGATTNWAGYFADGNVYIQNNVGIGTSNPLQTLDINGRMHISNGVIQRGGTAVTGTSDLGLYSRVAGNFIRLVTNGGAIRFYSDDDIGNNPNVTFESNGNVGLGTANPTDRLTVAGNAVPTLDNTFTCGKSGQRWSAVWSVNGTIQTSDSRMKENIHPLQYGLNEVLKLRPVSYNWKSKPQQGIKVGFIAQEVQPVLNELVVVGDDANKTLGINYAEFVPVLVNAIKEQQTQMEILKKENTEMKRQLSEILQLLKNK